MKAIMKFSISMVIAVVLLVFLITGAYPGANRPRSGTSSSHIRTAPPAMIYNIRPPDKALEDLTEEEMADVIKYCKAKEYYRNITAWECEKLLEEGNNER